MATMDEEPVPEQTPKDRTVRLRDRIAVKYTVSLADGTKVDETFRTAAIEVVVGSGSLLPAVEKAMLGMVAGESKQIEVGVEQGYGRIDPNLIYKIPTVSFPSLETIRVGQSIDLVPDTGVPIKGRVIEVADEIVTVDANHPYAGKNLSYQVTVVDFVAPVKHLPPVPPRRPAYTTPPLARPNAPASPAAAQGSGGGATAWVQRYGLLAVVVLVAWYLLSSLQSGGVNRLVGRWKPAGRQWPILTFRRDGHYTIGRDGTSSFGSFLPFAPQGTYRYQQRSPGPDYLDLDTGGFGRLVGIVEFFRDQGRPAFRYECYPVQKGATNSEALRPKVFSQQALEFVKATED